MKQRTIMLVFAYAVVTLLTVTPLAAATLNADGVKKVLVGKIWAEKGLGGLFSESFWEWKADGSICLRLFEKTGTCDYKGYWELKADRVCYILERRAGLAGTKSKCIRIAEPKAGEYEYEALDDNNALVFEFTVLK